MEEVESWDKIKKRKMGGGGDKWKEREKDYREDGRGDGNLGRGFKEYVGWRMKINRSEWEYIKNEIKRRNRIRDKSEVEI